MLYLVWHGSFKSPSIAHRILHLITPLLVWHRSFNSPREHIKRSPRAAWAHVQPRTRARRHASMRSNPRRSPGQQVGACMYTKARSQARERRPEQAGCLYACLVGAYTSTSAPLPWPPSPQLYPQSAARCTNAYGLVSANASTSA